MQSNHPHVDLGKLDEIVGDLRVVATGVPDAAAILDESGAVLFANEAFVRLSGIRPRRFAEEQRTRTLYRDFLRVPSSVEAAFADACTLERAVTVAEAAAASATGVELHVWATFIPVTRQGGQQLILYVVRDVSGEVELQRQLKTTNEAAAARTAALETQLGERTTHLSAALDEVARLSRLDPLTGVLGRRAFFEHVESSFRLAERHSRPVSIAACELLGLDVFEDVHGYSASEELVVRCAGALRETLRRSDLVGRLTDHRFLMLLPETDAAGTRDTVDRCVAALTPIVAPHTGLGFRFGSAAFPDDGAQTEQLVQCATRRLAAPTTVSVRPEPRTAPRPNGHAVDAPRVLLLDPDADRLREMKAHLERFHRVVATSSATEAIHACARGTFAAVIVAESLGERDGIGWLRQSFGMSPHSLRVLVVESDEYFIHSDARSFDLVDTIVVRTRAMTELAHAVDEGLTRRELLRRHLLSGAALRTESRSLDAKQLDQVLENQAFHVRYQPIVRCGDRRIVGHEALCRFDLESADPGDIFDLAARTGRVYALGRSVRERAVENPKWRTRDDDLFLNFHPTEFQDPAILIHEHALENVASRVVLEITERGAIRDFPRLIELLYRLRRRGYRLAVDDLGAGYAGLNSIALLSPDFIKIDMTLVRDIDKSATRRRLVSRVIDFANDEGVRVVAEGVETETEAATVEELGCHLMQGYHLGRPVRFDEEAPVAPTSPSPEFSE